MKLRYSTRILWSEEDGGFIASTPELSTVSAFGETQEEALAELQIALECMLESLEEDGITPPLPVTLPSHSGQFRLRIPPQLHTKTALAAEEHGVSLNTYIAEKLAAADMLSVVEKRLKRVEAFMQHEQNIQCPFKDSDWVSYRQPYTTATVSEKSGTPVIVAGATHVQQ